MTYRSRGNTSFYDHVNWLPKNKYEAYVCIKVNHNASFHGTKDNAKGKGMTASKTTQLFLFQCICMYNKNHIQEKKILWSSKD